jgi:hypothetical protein
MRVRVVVGMRVSVRVIPPVDPYGRNADHDAWRAIAHRMAVAIRTSVEAGTASLGNEGRARIDGTERRRKAAKSRIRRPA